LSGQGADRVLHHAGVTGADEVARMLTRSLVEDPPWAVLAPSTAWGREVAARLAIRLDAGLTGDAVGLEVRDRRLIALKPAFGGRLVAEITCTSTVQMATVRSGILPTLRPRPGAPFAADHLGSLAREFGHGASADRLVRILERRRDDDSDLLANADVVISVGQGVEPSELADVERLAGRLGAELCATRKVTDAGWMPRARQVGITGHAIAPRLCIAIGTSGKFNHTVGLRGATTVVGINPDPTCDLWNWCDVGLIADWRDALEPLIDRLVADSTVRSPA
ncbi:MAG: electron transfer flavoprotein subunit alpha/FixB family protein, partial [Acidimicrobiales bacterium]|nr:electron transfer flavoprotein subunit alpha/FixB family protein [Acidimicrobiales bacterium]